MGYIYRAAFVVAVVSLTIYVWPLVSALADVVRGVLEFGASVAP